MAPLFTGLRLGFGFGGGGASRGRFLTVPASVNAPGKWDLDTDGSLTLNGPATHTIIAGNPDGDWGGTISVAMWGGAGGAAFIANGGGGGGSFGIITLTNANTYTMVSGHSPRANPTLYPGGNAGGYSGIFETSETQGNAWMIAGGGGGGASYGAYNGGDGGGTTGGAGTGHPNTVPGGGGSQVSGGSAGSPAWPGFIAATAGSALRGGDGANGSPRGTSTLNPFPWSPGGGGQSGSNLNAWNTGGGGGGYYGGGGGGINSGGGDSSGAWPSGGGGGSGYINPSTVTGGVTYPYSDPNSFNHPLRGDAGTKGIYGTDIGYGSGNGGSGKIILS
jgi:hypothetical protein